MTHPRRGFTLKELLAVVTIIGILLALLVPWVQNAREAARAATCQGKQKLLWLASVNHHDTLNKFPHGASNRIHDDTSGQSSWGPSWLFAILPYCEAHPAFESISRIQHDDAQNDFCSSATRQPIANVEFKFLLCPSSPFPTMQMLGGTEIVVPSYAGIMGANDDAGAASPIVDQDQRIAPGPFGGFAAANGMLTLNEAHSMDACKDGTANVLLVGEVSSWYYHGRQRMNPALSIADAGDGTHANAGWLAGTDLDWKVEKDGAAIPAHRVLNLVTIEHPIGTNGRNGQKPAWGTQGIGRCGLNNPLLSAHPRGATVSFVDGQIRFLSPDISIDVLKRLAIRDDGAKVPDQE